MTFQMIGDNRFARAPQEIQKEDLEVKINTKMSQYDFCSRLDYFLPAFESPICSSIFLSQVYEGTIYAPKQSQINPVQRVDTPNMEECR